MAENIYHIVLFILAGIALVAFIANQVLQEVRKYRYDHAPVIEIRARLVDKTEGGGGMLPESAYYGIFESGNGHRFQLAMEKDHFYLLPPNIWGRLCYKSGWMISFHED